MLRPWLWTWAPPRARASPLGQCRSVARLSRPRSAAGQPTDPQQSVVDPRVRFPKQYFDFKAFRTQLLEKKLRLEKAEEREIRRAYAPVAPEGWSVETFLAEIDYGEGADEVAALFESWDDFISTDHLELVKIDIPLKKRRKILRYIELFTRGLWPQAAEGYPEAFKGKPYERDGPWEKQEDERLLELAEVYDVGFGDPWLYISHVLQRPPEDVQARYTEVVTKPRQQANSCEIAITKAARPLRMTRYFRLLPPNLFIVPSEQNFPLAPNEFRVPDGLQAFRHPECFRVCFEPDAIDR